MLCKMYDGLDEFFKLNFLKDIPTTRNKSGVQQNAPENPISLSWENDFTDPAQHNSQKFCYLVHALADPNSFARVLQMNFLVHRLSDNSDNKGFFNDDQFLNLLENPFKISDKKIISCSVIDQDHQATWQNAGLILRTPYQNIVKASSEDLGTDFSNIEKVLKQRERLICTVSDLLRQSSRFEWNEVVLNGQTDQGKVEVIGFFVKVFNDGTFVDEESARRISFLAARYNLPLVTLVANEMSYEDSSPKLLELIPPEPPFGVAYNKNGLRYVIDFERKIFEVISSKGKSRFMTRIEFDEMKQVIFAQLPEQDLQKIADFMRNIDAGYDECAANHKK